MPCPSPHQVSNSGQHVPTCLVDPTFTRRHHNPCATRPSPTRPNRPKAQTCRRANRIHKPGGAEHDRTSAQEISKKLVKKCDESCRTLSMAREAGGDPRAWLAVDETAAAFISRSLASRPPIILPPPLHRAPLRPGNVVEIAGPSNSGKSHLLLMVS